MKTTFTNPLALRSQKSKTTFGGHFRFFYLSSVNLGTFWDPKKVPRERSLVIWVSKMGKHNEHGPKMAFSSTRSFSTIREVKRSTGSGRAAPLKNFFFETHMLATRPPSEPPHGGAWRRAQRTKAYVGAVPGQEPLYSRALA